MRQVQLGTGRIGVSTMTLCAYSYGPGGIKRASWIARRAGLAGLKLTPLRGITKRQVRSLASNSVLSYEGDWRHSDDETSLVNWVLYGTTAQARYKTSLFSSLFPNAVPVDLGPQSAVETSPVNLRTEAEYFLYPGGVAVDLWHVRQFSWSQEASTASFVRTLAIEDKIRTIDFQTRDRPEFERFLAGGTSELGSLLRLATEHRKDISICIELPPQWLIFHPVRTLARISEQIHHVMNRS